MENLTYLRQLPKELFKSVQAYNKEILEKPEQDQQRALILTLALTIIAASGTGIAVKMGSLVSAAFTPLILGSTQTLWLVYNLNMKPEGKIDETIAKHMKTIIQYSLVAFTVFGTMGTSILLKNFSGFTPLFALFSGGSAIALWHTQGMKITT